MSIQLKLRRTQLIPLSNDELDDNFALTASSINTLFNTTEDLSLDITNINTSLSNNSDATITLSDAIDVHTVNISTINSTLLSISDRVTNNEANISDNTLDIAALNTSTDNLINRNYLNVDGKLVVFNSTEHAINGLSAIVINASNKLIDTDSVQTLSNKIFNGSLNTFVNVPASSLTGTLPIAMGGTAANNISTARQNLGLEIGVNVQAYNANTVISNLPNVFTDTQIFKSNNIQIEIGTGQNIKRVSLGVENTVTVNQPTSYNINFPNKSGVLATLDDINNVNNLMLSDIGVKVLAYDTNVVYTNKNNSFLGAFSHYFGAPNFKITNGDNNNNIVNFAITGNGASSNTTLNIPVESGTLATREYISQLIGAGSSSSYQDNGYHTFSNGFTIQWGSKLINQTQHSCLYNPGNKLSHTHSTTYGTIDFTLAFPHACFAVIPVARDFSSAYIDGCEMSVGIINKSISGFNFLINRITGCTTSGEVSMYVDYIAIGY